MGNYVAVPAVGGVRPPPPPPVKLTSDQYLGLFIRDVACSVLSLAVGIIILYQMCKPPARTPLERQLFKFIIHLVSRHPPQRSSLQRSSPPSFRGRSVIMRSYLMRYLGSREAF